MSFDTAVARIAYLQAALLPPAHKPPAAPPATGAGFAGALASASAVGGAAVAPGSPFAPRSAFGPGSATAPGGAVPPGPAGVVAAARGEFDLGVAEEPPGSNDGARIRTYRSAAGNPPPGPWCAYFTSWVTSQAGMPLGESGQGFGRVDDVWAWAQRSGRAVPAAAGPPQPGDLIVWDEHIGVVEAVLPDGRVQTIEGNSSDRVSRRVHPSGSALGYVRLG